MEVVQVVSGTPPAHLYPLILPNNFQHENGNHRRTNNPFSWNIPPEQTILSPPISDISQTVQSEESALKKELTHLTMLTIPFLLFPTQAAAYFAVTELLGSFLSKLGVPDTWNTLALIFVQCVDVRAFARGRFKLVPGWRSNYYQEIWDGLAGGLGFSDVDRLGSQYLFPQSGPPTYEQ